jgi:hypothetical protein
MTPQDMNDRRPSRRVSRGSAATGSATGGRAFPRRRGRRPRHGMNSWAYPACAQRRSHRRCAALSRSVRVDCRVSASDSGCADICPCHRQLIRVDRDRLILIVVILHHASYVFIQINFKILHRIVVGRGNECVP